MALRSRPASAGENRILRYGRLIPETSGASTVQYALVLVTVVGLASGLARLGQNAARQFGRAGDRLAAARFLPRQDSQAPSTRSTDREAATASGAAPTTWAFPGLIAAAAMLGASAIVAGRRKRKSCEDHDEMANAPDLSASERRCLFAKRQEILRVLHHNKLALFKSQVLVQHLMSHNLLTIREDTKVEEVRRLMREQQIRHILVCDRAGRLVGVVSDRDVSGRSGHTAADLMTPDPLSMHPQDHVGQAITLMMHQHISCLPVTHNGRLCGILTTTDLMMSLHCTLQILMQLAANGEPAADAGEAAPRGAASAAARAAEELTR